MMTTRSPIPWVQASRACTFRHSFNSRPAGLGSGSWHGADRGLLQQFTLEVLAGIFHNGRTVAFSRTRGERKRGRCAILPDRRVDNLLTRRNRESASAEERKQLSKYKLRRLVRTQARAQQAKRQDTLPIPSREEIINSPIKEDGTTSSFTFPPSSTESHGSPVMEDPSQDLERELLQKASAGARP